MASNEEYIKRNKVVTVDDDQNTKLHYAAALGNYDEAQKYIATGQKLDCENYLGWTPLMMAVRNGNMQIVTLLLDHRADASKKNKFGINVFLMSVAYGDPDTVAKILNHLLCGGISRQSLEKTLSPISLAIMFKQPHIFSYLIERSFDVNATTPMTGISPLMFAAAIGNTKAVKKLLKHNANIKLQNYLGKTAHDIMQTKNQKMEIDIVVKPKTPRLPMIIISPYNTNNPCPQLAPLAGPSNTHFVRKSSNVRTPNEMNPLSASNVTPITPQLIPQVFFPTNFTPSHFLSPGLYPQTLNSNEFLNTAFHFLSPDVLQMCYPNSA